tara:strand:- start:700 stop:3246 length:2547 start_codon:yes stop_codon:yes gene_type:complete
MSQEKILITFKSQGDTRLEKSILKIAKAQAILEQNERKLNQATEALNNSQKKHTATIDRQKKSLMQLNGSLRLTNNNFATLRSKLLLASFGFMLFQQGVMRFVNAASRQEEILNKFNTVFGRNADEVAKWADSYGDSIGRATSDLMEMAAGLQDIFVPMGFLRSEASELSKGLTQLAIDVASFSNASDEEVINAFKSAVVGNHETVRKYGIVITQAALKQEALTSGIIESDRAMTEQEKVLARINLLTKGTADAQGDAGRTADSFANRVKALQAAWKEFSESVGNEVLPVVTAIVNLLTNLTPLISLLAPRILELSAAYLILRTRIVKVNVVMGAYNHLTNMGIGLTRKLRLALAKSGIGIAVIGLSELIHKMNLFGDSSENTKEQFEESAKEALKFYSSLNKFIIEIAKNENDLASVQAKIEGLQGLSKIKFTFLDDIFKVSQALSQPAYTIGVFQEEIKRVIEELAKEEYGAQVPFIGTFVSTDMEAEYKKSGIDFDRLHTEATKKIVETHRDNFNDFFENVAMSKKGLDALGLAYIELNDTQGVLIKTEENLNILKQAGISGQRTLTDLLDKEKQLKLAQITAFAEILPNLEKEEELLQAKLTLDGATFEMEKLRIENAAIWADLNDENINAIFRQLDANEKLNKEIKKQNDLEKENERIIKAQKKERDAQISSLVRATTQFALYSQEVAKNMKELTEVILGELQKILSQFISNQILYSIFGIGDAPTLFGKTFQELLQGITGGASGTSVVQGANDLAVGVAHSGGMITSYHQGGNVPIIAQEGEFVMRRSAVESIGVENLNRMNRTGSAGVNVTFSGNVLSKSFIEREAIPMIKKAIRRGKTLG